MASVVLVIHMFLALAIIGLVMLQRSEGGGLGIGGGSGGLGGLATPQGTANILTRATSICAAGFFITSLTLGWIAGHNRQAGSLIDTLDSAPVAAAKQAPGEDAGKTADAPAAPDGEKAAATDEKAVAPETNDQTNDQTKNDAADKAVTGTETAKGKSGKDTGGTTPSAPISE